jgi:hypothetical protein
MGALENWKLCSLGVTLYVTTFELIWVLINISRKNEQRSDDALPVILINGALSEGIFVFVRIGETSGSNSTSVL